MSDQQGVGTIVIGTLRKHRSVPVDYLTEVSSRKPSEIEQILETLQREGVVSRSGNNVSLVRSGGKPKTLANR